MSIPSYHERQYLQQLCDRDVPDYLNELWAALETAWEAQEDLEAKVEKLEERILELEEEG